MKSIERRAKDYCFGSVVDPRARDIILLLLIKLEKLKEGTND